jgi:hypothetical protein
VDLIHELAEKAKWVRTQRRVPLGKAIHIACQGDAELKSQVGRLLGTRGAVQKALNKRVAQTKARARVGQTQLELFSSGKGA